MSFQARNSKIVEAAPDNVIAWAGHMTAVELATYLDEPGGRPDGEPHSDFMRDVGRFYDHDFLVAQSSDVPVAVAELARANGIRDSELISELEQRAEEPVSALILLWNYRLKQPFPNTFAGGKLRCLGSWPHPAPISD